MLPISTLPGPIDEENTYPPLPKYYFLIKTGLENGPKNSPSAAFSIRSRAHVRFTCSKQDRIVRKPVNASPGLKFIRIITDKIQIKILPFPSRVSLN